MIRASARHILVDSLQQCLALKQKIETGDDFSELARDFSSCPSRVNGGALGTFSRGQMVKEFDEVVFSAPLNAVQGPIETQFGFHLIEVTHRTD